jgi:hypothetical protein
MGLFTGYGSTALLISLLLAIVAGIAIFVIFLPRHRDGQFTGIVAWIRDFLNFKTLLAELVLRLLYVISACYITFSAFATLFTSRGSVGTSLLTFLITIIIGNVVARIAYELLLVVLLISKNTTEINEKLGGAAPSAPPAAAPSPYSAPYTPPTPAPAPEYAPPAEPVEPPAAAPSAAPSTAPAVSFCRNCGSALAEGEEFCPRCGVKK